MEDSFQAFALIAFTELAMGTRNAAVRKLAIPDLTTTVLTLTVTGIAAQLLTREGQQSKIGEKSCVNLRNVLGAVIIPYSISVALALATVISAVCTAALFRALHAR